MKVVIKQVVYRATIRNGQVVTIENTSTKDEESFEYTEERELILKSQSIAEENNSVKASAEAIFSEGAEFEVTLQIITR